VKTEDSELFEKPKIEPLKKSLNPCGFLLHPWSGYASLAPVSQTVIACKYLKVKHLKLHFKFPKVFHRAVENSVEILRGSSKRRLKREV
jgi:hypothetical protein